MEWRLGSRPGLEDTTGDRNRRESWSVRRNSGNGRTVEGGRPVSMELPDEKLCLFLGVQLFLGLPSGLWWGFHKRSHGRPSWLNTITLQFPFLLSGFDLPRFYFMGKLKVSLYWRHRRISSGRTIVQVTISTLSRDGFEKNPDSPVLSSLREWLLRHCM